MSAVFDAYAAYYDLLYRDKDYAAEARYVGGLLARHGVAAGSLLELGCGTGRHACCLADMGFAVHGIDRSPAMVATARRQAGAARAAALRFDTGDVRSARLDARFDGAISLFHVASYQTANEDLEAMFLTAAAHLRPGAVFVFDFWYGPGVLADRPATRVKELEDERVRVTRIAQPVMRPNENVVEVRYTVIVREKRTGATTELYEEHRMRYLFLPELRLLLEAAGLRIVQAEGWMSGELGFGSWQAVISARSEAQEESR